MMQSILQKLDDPFINFDSSIRKPITWSGSDVMVQSNFSLKIPVTIGSVIKYSFSTSGGDILFCADFDAPNRDLEAVIKSMRVPSDKENITGTFKSSRDGTITLIFDNQFSWFTAKLLTYNMVLKQPEQTLLENNRSATSQKLVRTIVDDTKKLQVFMKDLDGQRMTDVQQVTQLQQEIEALTAKLTEKTKILHEAKSKYIQVKTKVEDNKKLVQGLCIRMLNRNLLGKVFSYLDKTSHLEVCKVCKYWNCAAKEYEDNGVVEKE